MLGVAALAIVVGRRDTTGDARAGIVRPPPDTVAPADTVAIAAQGQDTPVDARAKGSALAAVTVYEMSDFQCPWCRRFALETLPILEREYIATGKVRLVFVNFPIPQLHANAAAAHEAAMCAARQGRFWPMHDVLFRQQEQWASLDDPSSLLVSYGDSVGADSRAFRRCIDTGAVRAEITAEARAAVQSGARSTPSFVIEGGRLEGAQGMEVWRPILDSILRAKESGPS